MEVGVATQPGSRRSSWLTLMHPHALRSERMRTGLTASGVGYEAYIGFVDYVYFRTPTKSSDTHWTP